MNENILLKSYTQHPNDLSVTPFDQNNGFSILRTYPKRSKSSKSGMLMLIRLFFSKGKFEFSIVITRENSDKGLDRISPAKFKVRNIVSNYEKPTFQFNATTCKIINIPTREEYGIEEFIENVLVENHLKHKKFILLKRKLSKKILCCVFWLAGKTYNNNEIMKERLNSWYQLRENGHIGEKVNNFIDIDVDAEPFFEIFKIHKNLLFAASIAAITLAIIWSYCKESNILDFDISNILTIICTFIVLFLLECLSKRILESLRNLRDGSKKTLLFTLHTLQLDEPDII